MCVSIQFNFVILAHSIVFFTTLPSGRVFFFANLKPWIGHELLVGFVLVWMIVDSEHLLDEFSKLLARNKMSHLERRVEAVGAFSLELPPP
jgi:hypothetical protein